LRGASQHDARFSNFGPAFRRLLLSASFFLIFAHPGGAQLRFLENGDSLYRGEDAGFLVDTPFRTKIDLSGPWTYAIDGQPGGQVRLPAAFDYTGTVAFQRTFELPQDLLERSAFQIVMLGENYSADVSINGEFVTSHDGGYGGLVEPVPQNALQPGSGNTIRISVGNVLSPKSTLPLRPQVWGMRNYGGIIRDFYLLAMPRLFIRNASVQCEPAENLQSARIRVRISVEGVDSALFTDQEARHDLRPAAVAFEIVEKVSGTPVAKSGVFPLVRKGNEWDEAGGEITLKDPRLWTPENPELYVVRCFVVRPSGKEYQVIDQEDVVTGIRKLALRGANFTLNGKRLILKGVTWYEDHPAWGSAMTYESREKDIVLIKNLGANLVRFIGHPPHPYMLNLCDRYGLLAMVELPLVQTPGPVMASDQYADLAAAALRTVILRDRNHPSVFAWGLGDEFETTHPAARPFLESLVRLARTLDGRFLYFGAVAGINACTDLVDIAAVDVRADDPKRFRAVLEEWRTAHRSQPVVVAKFGAEVQQENRNGTSDPLSQEAQARFYLQRFDMLRALDYDGGIVWSFNDWRGDRPALTVHSGDPYLHSMGVVNMQRERRLAYDAVRSIFRGEKYVALPLGTASRNAPMIYVLAGFVVLVGMAYIYNASRRFRESLNRSILNSYNFFADVRDQRGVSLMHSTLLGIVVALALAIVASSVLYHFRDSLLLDYLLSYLLVADALKKWAVELIWNPLRFITLGAGIIVLALVLLAGVVLLLRIFVRQHIYPFHAYTVTMWATAPFLVLVPVGMILYRVIESPVYILPALVLVAILTVWVFLRLLKGIALILDVFPLKTYLIGFLVTAAVGGAAYFYYDYAHAAPMYVSFLLSTIVPMH
jgi:hypothetical protein